MHAPLAQGFQTEWYTLATLASIASEWRDLAARAAEPNVFYEPSFLLPAAQIFAPSAGAIVVRSPIGKLLGLFPVQRLGWREGYAPRIVAGVVHPYGPLGTPLVDRDQPDAAIDACLDYLVTHCPGAAWLLPLIPDDGPFAEVLDRSLTRRNLRSAYFGRHRRAMLSPGANRNDYLEHTINPKVRKELNRKRRRLGESAPLSHRVADDPAAMESLISQFLDIEAAGWKGRAGTAMRKNPQIRAFMERAILDLAAEGKAHGESLYVGEEPVAAAIMLRGGEAVWAWKIAYDERFSRYSPGVQIALDVTRTLLANKDVARVDSCATPDHPMIDHIWRERLALSDRLIAPRPGFSPRFLSACYWQMLRRYAVSATKAARNALRRRSAATLRVTTSPVTDAG